MPRVTKSLPDKSLFYEGFASEFDAKMNMYDLQKRVRIVFDEMLKEPLEGKLLLDAGCGTGWFSKKAVERGASVVSVDLGINLLREVQKKTNSLRVASDAMNLSFRENTFDVVVSSEMLEHTPLPEKAFKELARVLKSGGLLILTAPNRLWHFSVAMANALRLRPYEGYENWVRRSDLLQWSRESGLQPLAIRGFHIVPFQIALLHPFIDFFDTYGNSPVGKAMINVALKARKL